MSVDLKAHLFKAAQGDMDAFGEIYNMLSVRIFNYARTILKSKEKSEDVTHDVFLQILKQASRLSVMADPVAYIMVTTRNHAFDQLKHNKRVTLSINDVPEVSYDSLPYDKLHIEDALMRLPVNQRETIYLHYICGYKQYEVAKIMGAPLVTVKWRCKKAMSQLRIYFEQEKEEYKNEPSRCDNKCFTK